MAEIDKQYEGKVRHYFTHNALHFHKQAEPAAKASMAAARQGKFWEYHDLLFENAKKLSDAKYIEFAEELKLDVEKFKKDMQDPAIKERLDEDQARAVALGARGTPAFFINGIKLSGAKPKAEFEKVINDQLEKAEALKKEGVPAGEIAAKLMRTNEGVGKYPDYFLDGKKAPRPKPPAKKADKKAKKKKPEDTKTVWKVGVRPNDYVKGPKHAPVTIVEFSEFQCPFCSKIIPTVTKLQDTFPGKVRVIFKHNPLSFHKEAPLASAAALAAGEQGKFWEMHDILFANQKALQRDKLLEYAKKLELDMATFEAAMDSQRMKDWIAEDQELSAQVEARGTPNLFINGRKFTGAKSFEELKPVVEAEIKKAEALIAKGATLENVYDKLIARGKAKLALEAPISGVIPEGATDAYGLGPKNAPITIVEFSDFQCPFCSRVGGPLKQAVKHYKGRVRLVFKHFPLSFHKDAALAAEASLAAGAQGRFWEMHDALFQNQKAMKREDLYNYAEALGLDMAKFKSDLTSRKYRKAVSDDMKAGQKIGVRGTPSVYINGRKYNPGGGFTVEGLIRTIDKNF